MSSAAVTAAGVDTWSLTWYVDPERSAAARFLREFATVPSKAGSWLLDPARFSDEDGEPVVPGYRIGWYPSGLVFADGHPDVDGGLCPASELLVRALDLQEAICGLGLPLPMRERKFWHLGASSEGFAGVRRCDATVNLAMTGRADGLGLLAGIAACARDAPGHAEVRYGKDRGVETVYLRGSAGRSALGRWYDKALEALSGPRGTLIRGEDQRRWPKGQRRDPEELDAQALRSAFQRRFLPLYRATKGVRVTGQSAIAARLQEAAIAGEVSLGEAEGMASEVFFAASGGIGRHRATRWRRQKQLRALGLVLADGVLEEVEVNVHEVLELALETDAWQRRG